MELKKEKRSNEKKGKEKSKKKGRLNKSEKVKSAVKRKAKVEEEKRKEHKRETQSRPKEQEPREVEVGHTLGEMDELHLVNMKEEHLESDPLAEGHFEDEEFDPLLDEDVSDPLLEARSAEEVGTEDEYDQQDDICPDSNRDDINALHERDKKEQNKMNMPIKENERRDADTSMECRSEICVDKQRKRSSSLTLHGPRDKGNKQFHLQKEVTIEEDDPLLATTKRSYSPVKSSSFIIGKDHAELKSVREKKTPFTIEQSVETKVRDLEKKILESGKRERLLLEDKRIHDSRELYRPRLFTASLVIGKREVVWDEREKRLLNKTWDGERGKGTEQDDGVPDKRGDDEEEEVDELLDDAFSDDCFDEEYMDELLEEDFVDPLLSRDDENSSGAEGQVERVSALRRSDIQVGNQRTTGGERKQSKKGSVIVDGLLTKEGYSSEDKDNNNSTLDNPLVITKPSPEILARLEEILVFG